MPKYQAPPGFTGTCIYIGGGCYNLDANNCIDTGDVGDYSIPLAGWQQVELNQVVPAIDTSTTDTALAQEVPNDPATQTTVVPDQPV
jgi:hypothetical protein